MPFYAGSNQLDVARAIFLGNCVMEAERVDTKASLPYTMPQGYTLLFTFEGNDIVTDATIKAKDDSLVPTIWEPFGFVASSNGPGVDGKTDVIVIFRGTNPGSVWEWLQDAFFAKKTFPFVDNAGETEDGFTDMYGSLGFPIETGHTRLIDKLAQVVAGIEKASVTIAGHSLGSALATLLALEVAAHDGLPIPSVYTFASPYVGDEVFQAKYDDIVPNTWRIANLVDIVTHMPPSLLGGYKHVGQVVQMNFLGKVKTSIVCFHALTSYLHFLSIETSTVMQSPLSSGCQPNGLFGL